MRATIGVDIGGTKIALGVVDEDGRILARTRRVTPATDPERITEAVVEAVEELTDLVSGHDVEAVGVAAAGYIDADRSTVLFAPNLSWRAAPLRGDLEAKTSLPVVVENDANAAAWGEFQFGAGRDVDDMLMLTLGTGLGGGVVVGGELVRGAHGVAAELGHVRAVPGGHRCGCGNRGCWEQYVSGTALVREARELAGSGSPLAAQLVARAGGSIAGITGPVVTTAAEAGDRMALDLLRELGQQLGLCLASFVAMLDPAVVVVGGGVSEAGELLLGPARVAFDEELTGRGYRPGPRIVRALLGNDAGLVGVADLARRR